MRGDVVDQVLPVVDDETYLVMAIVRADNMLTLLLGGVAKRWRQPKNWNQKLRIAALESQGMMSSEFRKPLPSWLEVHVKCRLADF